MAVAYGPYPTLEACGQQESLMTKPIELKYRECIKISPPPQFRRRKER